MTESGCQECQENTFSSAGAKTCTKCPDGKVSTAGSTSPDGCQYGVYVFITTYASKMSIKNKFLRVTEFAIFTLTYDKPSI